MCDTFVVMPSNTKDGSVIFGKNSDREPNEAQILEYYPSKEYPEDATVTCTYLEIPQKSRTNAVLLSRPFWMWGAEMGANEKGVVIGNEAVWTKMPLEREGRLTGMDLLRLTLERADTAEQALEVITNLLMEYGQGGSCGYENKRLTYHNSFLISDPEEAWVLETAGHLWAALKVKESYAISNGLTIGEEFDLSHRDLIDTARKNDWLKEGKNFHFARCYSDWFYTTFSKSKMRRSSSMECFSAAGNNMTVPKAFAVLRDHGHNDYHPDSHFLMNHICAHSANTIARHATQSTGSLVAHLKGDVHTFWGTGTSAPCLSVFKPIWFKGKVLPDLGRKTSGAFSSSSLWWNHERLHRTTLMDFPVRSRIIQQERDSLEHEFIKASENAVGDNYYAVTKEAFSRAEQSEEDWFYMMRGFPIRKKPKLSYRYYWRRQNKKAGIKI